MVRFLSVEICLLLLLFSCDAQNHSHTNHLINETSPYLQQHAHNPVDWYPWGAEALEKAATEDKMLIISIGYSSCHWCHVMERESFEDTSIARLMNEHFVSIKVDREERPDIDDIYLTACQLASGDGCGWPLNSFAMPDGRPVWSGTYFPPKRWKAIIEYFIEIKEKSPEKLEEFAGKLTEGIQDIDDLGVPALDSTDLLDETFAGDLARNLLATIDFEKGGRKGAPKFPTPVNYEFLLNWQYRTGNVQALEAVNTTLENMAKGGIYDQLGGGFSRYSVDEDWKVPHFEKMLYDNAQLVSLYAKAYAHTGNPLYQTIVKETLSFVDQELRSDEGAFYSSLDADSDGEEGKFYSWTKEEIVQVLQEDDLAELFCSYYGVTQKGNWENGYNILQVTGDLQKLAQSSDKTIEQLQAAFDKARQRLLEVRSRRIQPGLDDKVLTSWNALMLTAYLDAYRYLGDAEYLQTANENLRFLMEKMLQKDGKLHRTYKNDQSRINAFLEDYALLIQSLIQMYEVSFEEQWLDKAGELMEYCLDHFYEEEAQLFNYTSDLDPPLIARKRETTDNVIPASNSVMARNLLRLSHYFYREEWAELSRTMLGKMTGAMKMSEQAGSFSNWNNLLLEFTYPLYEVAIVGRQYQNLQKPLLEKYLPNVLLLGGAGEGSLELLKDKLVDDQTYIYVCQNRVCKLPVQEADQAIKQVIPGESD